MNYGRTVLAALVANIVYYAYGFLSEGWLLRNDFAPYSAVYRSSDTLMTYMPLGLAFNLIAIFVVAIMYAKGYEGGSGAAEGARFGFLVGVFVMCAFTGANYVILNIGRKLSLELAASSLLQWTLVGTTIGLLSKPASRRAG